MTSLADQEWVPMPRLEQAAGVLRVLAHPHRLRICEILLHDRVCVKAIAEHLQIPRNAASQHLNMMKAHGILGCRREGKTIYYHVVDPRPAWLLSCIREHGETGGRGEGETGRGGDRGTERRREGETERLRD